MINIKQNKKRNVRFTVLESFSILLTIQEFEYEDFPLVEYWCRYVKEK